MSKKIVASVLSNGFDGKIYLFKTNNKLSKNIENNLKDKLTILKELIEDYSILAPMISKFSDYITLKLLELEKRYRENKNLNIEDLTQDDVLNLLYNDLISLSVILDLENDNKDTLKKDIIKLYSIIIKKDIFNLDIIERMSFLLYKYNIKKKLSISELRNWIRDNFDKYIDFDYIFEFLKNFSKDKNTMFLPVNYNLFLKINQMLRDYLKEKKLLKEE